MALIGSERREISFSQIVTGSDVAYRGFQWPKLERFNWALDWFDSIAAGERCNQPAIGLSYH